MSSRRISSAATNVPSAVNKPPITAAVRGSFGSITLGASARPNGSCHRSARLQAVGLGVDDFNVRPANSCHSFLELGSSNLTRDVVLDVNFHEHVVARQLVITEAKTMEV